MADFETAILATGRGKFNYLFLALMIPSAAAISFDVTQMSYILPVAQCDLDLDMKKKSILNTITFVGLIISGPFGGCLADTLGRKTLAVTCYFAHAIITVLCGMQTKYYAVLLLKFCAGVVVNGAASGYYTCIPEFHSSKFRGKLFLFNGMMISLGALMVPLIAWGIMGNANIQVNVGYGTLKSWNFYIIATSTMSWIAAIGHLMLPENPKYLMMNGKYDDALVVFRRMYVCNTGEPAENYPITEVVYEKQETEAQVTSGRTRTQAIAEAPKQLKPLFLPPYLWYLLIVTGMQFSCMYTYNGVRFWIPNFFTVMEDLTKDNPANVTFCNTLVKMTIKKTSEKGECKTLIPGLDAYTRKIISVSINFVIYTLEAIAVDTLFSKRTAVTINCYISAACGVVLFFSKAQWLITGLISCFPAFAGACVHINMSIAAGLFPTSTRALALGMTMTMGRLGSLTGHNLVGLLLKGGCTLTMVLFIVMVALCGTLVFVIPKRAKET